jgi:hypothetical protein
MVNKNKAVGFPEWTAQLSVWKTTGKDSSEVCAIACQNCAVYSVFPSGMTAHSEIAQFNWDCIAPLKGYEPLSYSNWLHNRSFLKSSSVVLLPITGTCNELLWHQMSSSSKDKLADIQTVRQCHLLCSWKKESSPGSFQRSHGEDNEVTGWLTSALNICTVPGRDNSDYSVF